MKVPTPSPLLARVKRLTLSFAMLLLCSCATSREVAQKSDEIHAIAKVGMKFSDARQALEAKGYKVGEPSQGSTLKEKHWISGIVLAQRSGWDTLRESTGWNFRTPRTAVWFVIKDGVITEIH